MKKNVETSFISHESDIFYNRANRKILELLRDLQTKLKTLSRSTHSYSMADLEQPHDTSGIHIDIMRRSSAWDENIKQMIRSSLSETIGALLQGISQLFELSARSGLTGLHLFSEFDYVSRPIFPNHPTPTRYEKLLTAYTFGSVQTALLKIQELYNRYTSIEFLNKSIRSRDPSCVTDHGNIQRILTHDQSFMRIHTEISNLIVRFLSYSSQNYLQINLYIEALNARIIHYKTANHGKKDQQERVVCLEFLIRQIHDALGINDLEKHDRCFLLLKEYVESIKSGKEYTFGFSLRTLTSSQTCSLQKALCELE